MVAVDLAKSECNDRRMNGFRRGDIEIPTYLDQEGKVIDYGRRWGMDNPPTETYSVCEHPERFRPIVGVAERLIDYLRSAYQVTVVEEVIPRNVDSDIDVVRRVSVTPKRPTAAPLTFDVSSFPGVRVRAGFAFGFTAPHCGCDACDDSVEGLIDELIEAVQAVVDGRLRERVVAGKYEYHLEFADGRAQWGEPVVLEELPSNELRAMEDLSSRLIDGWQRWELLSTAVD